MKNISKFLSNSNGKIIALFILLIVALFAYYFYSKSNNVTNTTEEVIISQSDNVRGALDGKVTLVEFGDFQCPACAAYEPIVKKLMESNKNDLKIVFKHFPLTQIHQNALLAAKASESAGVQGKFWEMHDLIYEKQKEWSGALNARDMFLAYASSLSLDTEKFKADLDKKEIADKVVAEMREGIKLKVAGTPSFFINGKKIENPSSFEAFDKMIKEAAR